MKQKDHERPLSFGEWSNIILEEAGSPKLIAMRASEIGDHGINMIVQATTAMSAKLLEHRGRMGKKDHYRIYEKTLYGLFLPAMKRMLDSSPRAKETLQRLRAITEKYHQEMHYVLPVLDIFERDGRTSQMDIFAHKIIENALNDCMQEGRNCIKKRIVRHTLALSFASARLTWMMDMKEFEEIRKDHITTPLLTEEAEQEVP